MVGLRADGGDESGHRTAVRRDRHGGDEDLGGLRVVTAVGAVGAVLGADVEDGLLHPPAAQGGRDRRGQGGGGLGAEQGARGGVHAQRGAVGALDDDADADRVEQRVEQVRQLPGGCRHGLDPLGIGTGVAEPARAGMTRSPDEHAGLPRTITRSVWIVTLSFRCVTSSERRNRSGGGGGATLGWWSGRPAAAAGGPAWRNWQRTRLVIGRFRVRIPVPAQLSRSEPRGSVGIGP